MKNSDSFSEASNRIPPGWLKSAFRLTRRGFEFFSPTLTCIVLLGWLALPLGGLAQGVIGSGENKDGTVLPHSSTTTTFTAAVGDRIILQLGKLTGGAGFTPKIELLAPAVNDAGRQPANCEYPWAGPDGAIRVPAEYNFGLDLLHEKAGRHLLKVLYAAAEDLTRPEP